MVSIATGGGTCDLTKSRNLSKSSWSGNADFGKDKSDLLHRKDVTVGPQADFASILAQVTD
ncbi:hypothetical protein BH11ARM2_BH11ARM2_04370 [soil metagenome]